MVYRSKEKLEIFFLILRLKNVGGSLLTSTRYKYVKYLNIPICIIFDCSGMVYIFIEKKKKLVFL